MHSQLLQESSMEPVGSELPTCVLGVYLTEELLGELVSAYSKGESLVTCNAHLHCFGGGVDWSNLHGVLLGDDLSYLSSQLKHLSTSTPSSEGVYRFSFQKGFEQQTVRVMVFRVVLKEYLPRIYASDENPLHIHLR